MFLLVIGFAFAQEEGVLDSEEVIPEETVFEEEDFFEDGFVEEEVFIEEESEDDIFEGYEDAELEVGAGITPDSGFYFVDEIFDGFGSDLDHKEEKVAEIKAMVEAGNIDAASEALDNYKGFADELEKEVEPGESEEAKRSAAAIRNTLREIEAEIPEDARGEFVDDVIDKERSIATAAEIASKIKELCEELAGLDVNEYYSVCKSDEDSPKWQRELDEDLTEEQKKEAKKFGEIMSACFETSGQDCRCDEIPFTEFANVCSAAAPLATACDIDGDEAACDKLDSLEMPRLPDHLQDVFDDIEDGMMESKFDMHMPPECVEAGVTSGEDCSEIMITTHAPEECKQPLLDSGCDSEWECREICDEIMMEKHAPECFEEGITDPDECARFMDDFRGDDHFGGPMIDFNCKEIEDAGERLDCYDKASSQAKGFRGVDEDFEGDCMTESDWSAKKSECRNLYGEHAGDRPIMGDSGQGWECVVDAECVDFGDYSSGSGCDDCASQCPGASRTDCVNDRCECYYDDPDDDWVDPGEGWVDPSDGPDDCSDPAADCAPPEGYENGGTGGGTDEGIDGGIDGIDIEDGTGGGTDGGTEGGTDGGGDGDSGGTDGGSSDGGDSGSSDGGGDSGGSDSGGDSGGGDSGGSSDGGGDSGGDSGGGEITGGVVADNDFLNYYYSFWDEFIG